MKHILKKLALLSLPVWVWLAFFVAFEPNNYFGLKSGSGSSQPIARVRAWEQAPGENLILGDSRLAHFDMALIAGTSGEEWQNLAFGGASLRECIDLANYILDAGGQPRRLLFAVSFYTLNAGYDTDRFSALEETLHDPLAYCLNLEYNVNALTVFLDTVRGTPDAVESGDWGPADYLDENGAAIPLHRRLYDYPATIAPRCAQWTPNDAQLDRLAALAARCRESGVALTVVLPPMAANVRSEVCDRYGITAAMENEVLPALRAMAQTEGFALLDYEWGGSCITDDDTQFFDGFHLDEKYGLPDWTRQLFGDMA